MQITALRAFYKSSFYYHPGRFQGQHHIVLHISAQRDGENPQVRARADKLSEVQKPLPLHLSLHQGLRQLPVAKNNILFKDAF